MTAPTLSPALVLLCGASFSGKSSLGQVLADGLGAQIVSLDAINGERGLREAREYLSLNWRRRMLKHTSALTNSSAGAKQ
jgi:tRNA A37 N6-isopentenylltransferase MiaA